MIVVITFFTLPKKRNFIRFFLLIERLCLIIIITKTMSLMISIQLSGGLGNQMFQYSIGIILQLENKINVKYDLCVNGTSWGHAPWAPATNQLLLCRQQCSERGMSLPYGLIAFFLRTKQDIMPDEEVRFPYQEPTFHIGVQVYLANRFWKQAAFCPPVLKGWHLVLCNCAGTPGHCPHGYG